MTLDEIKRGLSAEIVKRKDEHYFTFQTNIHDMCKDCLDMINELDEERKDLREENEQLKKDLELARKFTQPGHETIDLWQKVSQEQATQIQGLKKTLENLTTRNKCLEESLMDIPELEVFTHERIYHACHGIPDAEEDITVKHLDCCDFYACLDTDQYIRQKLKSIYLLRYGNAIAWYAKWGREDPEKTFYLNGRTFGWLKEQWKKVGLYWKSKYDELDRRTDAT